MLRDLIDLFATPRSRVRRGHRSAAPMVQPPCDEVFAGFAAGAALQAEQRRGNKRGVPLHPRLPDRQALRLTVG
jgi:hypothetical protein